MKQLLSRKHWVFDLDGTITQPIFDFPKIKRRLGLPPDQGILEVLRDLPDAQAEPIHRELDEIEGEMVEQASIAEGVRALIETLARQGVRLGILTRNKRHHALRTLEVVEMNDFFPSEFVLGRDEAAHKPSPDGVERLLQAWGADPGDAVMVGDFLFDLQAGRSAGVATVYVDESGSFPHRAAATVCVQRLDALLGEPVIS